MDYLFPIEFKNYYCVNFHCFLMGNRTHFRLHHKICIKNKIDKWFLQGFNSSLRVVADVLYVGSGSTTPTLKPGSLWGEVTISVSVTLLH